MSPREEAKGLVLAVLIMLNAVENANSEIAAPDNAKMSACSTYTHRSDTSLWSRQLTDVNDVLQHIARSHSILRIEHLSAGARSKYRQ